MWMKKCLPRLCLFAVTAGLIVLTGCSKPAAPAETLGTNSPVPPPAATVATNGTSAGTNTVDLQKLKGRWLRPDGGYVIEIRQVDASGQLEASYFNPNPIRVVNSVAKHDGPAVKVYLELNDVNYPGCKYDLTYLPNRDLLVGTYFQAALQQTFDVFFQRTK
jgi:hypothetical protein